MIEVEDGDSAVKLFMFYLGGSAPRANIEVHDVQFVAARAVTEAYPTLIERWFGEPHSLHVDAWTVITWADGYEVTLAPEPPTSDLRLYFVNLGGARPGELAEVHEFGLFVSDSAGGASSRAKQRLLTGTPNQHRDNLLEVDDCLMLSSVSGHFVQLTPRAEGTASTPDFQGYLTRDQMLAEFAG